MERVYNFSPGPSMLAQPVLEKAQKDLMVYGNTGMSVMEMSHRSKMYTDIFDKTVADLRALMHIGDDYEVLLLQGGATLQFSAIPLNLMVKGKADYVDSGNFAHLAAEEAKRYGEVNIAATSRADNYTYVPDMAAAKFDPDADYVHITQNNTIYGTRFVELPDVKAPLVADASSMILSEPMDVNRYGVIYAGAQKNIGPSGLVVVIVREDLLGRARSVCPTMLNYKIAADNGSMYNTPATYSWYLSGLVFEWLKEQGGVTAMEQRNRAKKDLLYKTIDASDFYTNPIQPSARSWMNVPFRLADERLDKPFLEGAEARGLLNLKGHRSVGGMRASIYNALGLDAVEALVAYMAEFEKEHG